jgi:hypothetical protein
MLHAEGTIMSTDKEEPDLEHLHSLVLEDFFGDLEALAVKHRDDPNPDPTMQKILRLIQE